MQAAQEREDWLNTVSVIVKLYHYALFKSVDWYVMNKETGDCDKKRFSV